MAVKTASGSDLRNSLSSGLVLLNTTSFSGVASQSINDVFSATYTNYRIVSNITGSTTSQLCNLRLRVAGSDNSSTNYHRQYITADNTSISGGRTSGDTSWVAALSSINSTSSSLIFLEIQNPFQTAHTAALRLNNQNIDNGSTIFWGSVGFGITVTTSYTGFTFFPASGTMTGEVSVYGFNK